MKEARYHFNPCMFSGVIYLCGPCNPAATIMEAFSPETNTFLAPIPVPENSYNCVYVDNGQLVVHFPTYIRKYTAGPDGQLVMQSDVRKQAGGTYFSSQPVIDKTRGFYYIIQSTTCLSYNLETGVQGPSVG